MSSHNDHDNHSTEPKEVSFRTPMIMAFVTVLIILLGVSTCDKGHGCCEDGEKCEAACEAKHGEHGAAAQHGTETHEAVPATEGHAAAPVDTTATAVHDTTAVQNEAHAEPAHH
ncbi:MAG: hypothetical protein V4677_01820 [Bacteroidota bacterium]